MCSIAFCNFSISPERSDFRYYERILKPLHIFVNIYISFSSWSAFCRQLCVRRKARAFISHLDLRQKYQFQIRGWYVYYGWFYIAGLVLWRCLCKSAHCHHRAQCCCSPFWSFAPCLWAQTVRGPWHWRSPALTPSVQLWLSMLTVTWWHSRQCTTRSNRQACRQACTLHTRAHINRIYKLR